MNERGYGATRRAVVLGAGAVGAAVGAGLLAGCGSDGGGSGEETGEGLARTDEIPVGGGVVRNKVIITQPSAGVFKAYDAVCTHAGCTVSQFRDGLMLCGCHDSKFSAADGSVVGGPASRGLNPVSITVKGDTINLE